METKKKQRSFTLRLGEEEVGNLEKLQDLLCLSTDTGVIKFLINNFESLNNRYLKVIQERQVAEQKSKQQRSKIRNFCIAFNELKEVINDGDRR